MLKPINEILNSSDENIVAYWEYGINDTSIEMEITRRAGNGDIHKAIEILKARSDNGIDKSALRQLYKLSQRFSSYMLRRDYYGYIDFSNMYSERDIMHMIISDEYYIIVDALEHFVSDEDETPLALLIEMDIFRIAHNY